MLLPVQDLHKLGVQEGDLLHMDNTVQMHKPVPQAPEVALCGLCARSLEAAPLLPAHRGDRRQGAPQSQAGAALPVTHCHTPLSSEGALEAVSVC